MREVNRQSRRSYPRISCSVARSALRCVVERVSGITYAEFVPPWTTIAASSSSVSPRHPLHSQKCDSVADTSGISEVIDPPGCRCTGMEPRCFDLRMIVSPNCGYWVTSRDLMPCSAQTRAKYRAREYSEWVRCGERNSCGFEEGFHGDTQPRPRRVASTAWSSGVCGSRPSSAINRALSRRTGSLQM